MGTDTPLFLDQGLEAVTAFAYLGLAWVVSRRHVPRRFQAARDSFAAWWASLGALTTVAVVLRLFGFPVTRLSASFLAVAILLLVAGACASLAYYQATLLGRPARPAPAILGYYGLVFLVFDTIVLTADPVPGLLEGTFTYGEAWLAPTGLLSPWILIAFLWAALGPCFVMAVLLLLHSDRVRDARVKERAFTTSAAIFVWVLFVMTGSITLLSGEVPGWVAFAGRMVNLFAVVTVLLTVRRAHGPRGRRPDPAHPRAERASHEHPDGFYIDA